MGFADKVKGPIDEGSGPGDEASFRRRMDSHAEELGYIVYRERCGTPAPPGEIERLVYAMYEVDKSIFEIQQKEYEAAQAAAAKAAAPPQAEAATSAVASGPGGAPPQSAFAPESQASPEGAAPPPGGPPPGAAPPPGGPPPGAAPPPGGPPP
ncbi:MAG: hypothetical protein K1X95_14880, partial [Acidimicrobiia bacterium]|nr:hypothetical protein [Acidimicrobiia bacterium]